MDVQEIDRKVSKLKQLRAKKADLEQQKKELTYEYDMLKAEVIADLEGAGLERFSGSEGAVSLVHKTSVRLPVDPKKRRELFEYFRATGIYDDMITVHSQRLNSWYRDEKELKAEDGDFDWEAPGLGEPVTWTDIQLRGVK